MAVPNGDGPSPLALETTAPSAIQPDLGGGPGVHPAPPIKPTRSAVRRARVRGVNAGLHYSLLGGRLAVGE